MLRATPTLITPPAGIALSDRARRTAPLFVAVVLFKPFSNLFLAWGVRNVSAVAPFYPAFLIHLMFHPLVWLGIGMQVFWLLARMALLSVADLSYVLPVTASGYVISVALGRIFLHETVSAAHWAGALLIFAGATLVGSTPRYSATSSKVIDRH